MRIVIITIIDNINIGTYLQALALGTVLNRKGCDVEIIDYQRKHETVSAEVKVALGKNLIKMVYNLFYGVWRNAYQKRQYHKFVSKSISFTPIRYKTFESLKNNTPEADIYLTGSDQVWNSIHNRGVDKAYYLDFAPSEKTRAAYGASIGMDKFPAQEIKETTTLLSKYDYLSVREFGAKKILSDLAFSDVEIVMDPTLLLRKTDWESMINKNETSEDYLLIYTVETKKENAIIEKIAKKIAKLHGLKLYNVSYFDAMHGFTFCDRNFCRATPNMFLNLMLHAKFVIASSFHGTAFAINFNKQFLSISPNRFNSRVQSLLSLCKLENRLVTDDSFSVDGLKSISYDNVNKILDIEREKSQEYIDKILNKN